MTTQFIKLSLSRTATALTFCALVLCTLPTLSTAQENNSLGPLSVQSKNFQNDELMPLITINNIISNGTNACSLNAAPGGDQSPELSWAGQPWGTKTFVVTAFDITASFTHWGMYNIPASVTHLPLNAGVANSPYGQQVVNDFGAAAEYDGPCPPANVAPYTHKYLFTVYALDIKLNVTGSTNFPANAETLYHALIDAGERGHILASGTLTGLYSTTPSQ